MECTLQRSKGLLEQKGCWSKGLTTTWSERADDYLERKVEAVHTSSALMTFLSSASPCILLRASPACLLLCCSCSV